MKLRKILPAVMLVTLLCGCAATKVEQPTKETQSIQTEATNEAQTADDIKESDATKEAQGTESIQESGETQMQETTAQEPGYAPEGLWETEEAVEVDYSNIRSIYEEGQAEREAQYKEMIKARTSPILNVVTEDGHSIKDKTYHPVVLDLFNCDPLCELTGIQAEVKVRGNSSANSSPYPYRIRFEEKQNMLGLHDGRAYRSWVLLKPYWTFCPNCLALNMAQTIFEGEYYVSDCEYVNLYMNGKYQGLYLLCEQNQVAKGRVEVNEPKYGNTDTKVGYFVEMDNNIGDDHPYFYLDYHKRSMTDMLDKERELPEDDYSVISDIWCDAQLDFARKYMGNTYDILWEAIIHDKAMAFDENYDLVEATGITPEEAVRNVIDVRSFLNMLLLEELVQNYDVGAGSFYFCFDLSEDAQYNKLTLTCPWDFNWAYEQNANSNYYASTWQIIKDNYDRSNVWFVLLMKAPWFQDEFYQFVNEVEASQALATKLDEMDDYIENYREDLGDDNWMVDQGHNIIDFARKRMKFLLKESAKRTEEETAAIATKEAASEK